MFTFDFITKNNLHAPPKTVIIDLILQVNINIFSIRKQNLYEIFFISKKITQCKISDQLDSGHALQ